MMMRPLTGPLDVSGSTIPGLLFPSEQPAATTASGMMSLRWIMIISIVSGPYGSVRKHLFVQLGPLITDADPYVLYVSDDTYL